MTFFRFCLQSAEKKVTRKTHSFWNFSLDEENKFISEIIPQSLIWLNIISSQSNQTFLSSNGSPLSYDNWNPTSPNFPVSSGFGVCLNSNDEKWIEQPIHEKKSLVCGIKSLYFQILKNMKSQLVLKKISEYCIRIKSDENLCEKSSSNADNEVALYQDDRIISNIPFDFNDFEYCFSFDEITKQDIFKIQATQNGVS